MSSRYGISAMEMTTAEIFADMKMTDVPKELLTDVQSLFERADFVKFAKYVASDEDNASVLPLAVRFVTETYQTEVLEENETSKDAEQVAGTQIGIEATTEEQTTSLTYEDLNLVMYASESLNVRDLPNEDGEIIGNLIAGKRVKITGRCNQTDWYRISYGDGEGFVCHEYLVEECPVSAPDIVAEAAILYDMDTGEVLYEKNADARMYPASVTKIMTTMLACESGRLDEMITFSQRCKEVPYDSSIYGVRVGESVTLRDSLYMLMLVSGNDVGVGIAEHLSANEGEFAALMTKRATSYCPLIHYKILRQYI